MAAVQVEYSLFTLDSESKDIVLLDRCRELSVAIIAYVPIGRGMLSVAIRSCDDLESGDFRRLMPRFSEENFPKDLELVDEINALAKEMWCTAS